MDELYHATFQLPLFPSSFIVHITEACSCAGKQCTQCTRLQCLGNFHRYIRSKDGYRNLCKTCRKAESGTEEFKVKRREHHKKNAEHINEKKREWYHSDPERPREHARQYRERNPEKVAQYTQEYNDSERGKERERRYKERHPEKVKETHRKSWYKHHEQRIVQMRVRHARTRTLQTGAGGAFTVAEWEDLKTQYNYTCPGCGRKEPEISLTVDHKTPVTKLGTSHIENIQPLCTSCNARKGTKIIDYREEKKHCG